MNSEKRFALTIAATIRNEGRYLAEWIEYHSLIGFEHFYLYDNNSTDDTSDFLREYLMQGRATLLTWPEYPGQTMAYNHAIKIFGRDCDWMALIDLDEFIRVDPGRSLRERLGDLSDADQVLLPWVHFGSSGHETRPDGLVIESYTHRVAQPHRQPKAIVRPEAVLWAEIHHCETRYGKAVDPAGQRVPERWILDRPPEGPIRVHHYFTKSRAEFAEKLARGQGDGGRGKTMETFTRYDCPVADASLATMGSAVRKAMEDTRSRPRQPLVHAAWSAQSELSPSRTWTLSVTSALRDLRDRIAADAVIDTCTKIDFQQLVATRLDATMLPFDSVRRTLNADPLCKSAETGSWRNVGPSRLGRAYVSIACRADADTQLEVEMDGVDAGRKSVAVRLPIAIPAGDSVTFAILSERTVVADRVRLNATAPIEILEARIESFV